jgi:tetratricopeptide (TPR) repeat protein
VREIMAKRWKEEDEEFLRNNYQKLSDEQLAEKIGVAVTTIKSKLKKMGLSQIEEKKSDPARKVKETTEAAKTKKKNAIEDYSKFLGLYQKGLEKFRKGEYQQAIELFQSLVDKVGDFSHLTNRAMVYIKICNARLQKKKITLSNVEDYYLWGVFKFNEGNFEEALKHFQQALNLKPGDDRILYLLASTYVLMEDKEHALKYLEDAIKINNKNKIFARHDNIFHPLKGDKDFEHLTMIEEEQIIKVEI